MAQKHNADYAEKPMTRDGRVQGPSRRYRRLRNPNFTAAEWAAKNPLLQRGEFGIEIDTNRMKAGNGYTLWNDLPYMSETVATWGSIGGDINDQADLINMVDGKVADEATARENADAALGTRIDNETTARTNADNALGVRIDNVIDDLVAETTARENADSTLQNNIDGVASDLSAETIARQNADGVLQGNIDTVAGDLSAETTARENADTALQGQITSNKNAIDAHVADTANPHQVTKAQVGLGNVDNTSDLAKPISTATQAALDGKANVSLNNLDATGTQKFTTLQTQITNNKNAIDTHVADTTNPHNVTKAQVGLGNVDNTADADKPVSTAQQAALDGKQNISTANYQMGNANGAWTTMTTAQQNALNSGATTAKINAIATNTQAIADEVARATGAESALSDRITANTNNFANYRTAAAQDAIDATLATKTELGNETTARESADNALGGRIDTTNSNLAAETTARQNADSTLQTNITNETNARTAADTTLQGNITAEITARQNADNGLQAQIDAIVSKSDVVDIVGTYAELQAYDTSGLGNNDVVKVLDDSTHNDAQSYYRWVITGGVGAWVYIGSEAETYTKAETDALLNDKQDVISDLATIRAGAALGATALQPGDNVSELVNDAGYLTQHQTLVDLGITATASEINVLDGITASTAELNYTDGVTSNIQTQLNGKQATISDLATIRSGAALGATAVQPGDLATVATSGSYNDLSDKPTIGNGTLTVQANGTTVATFGANQTANTTANITVPTDTSDLTNTAGFITSAALAPYAKSADLATVATSGSYNDLTNKPTIPAAQVNADWNANSGVAQILNKPTLGTAAAADTTDFATAAQGALADTAVQPTDLAAVATSGSYTDLSDKPTIPTVNNATLTIQRNGAVVQTFTANQATNATANITVPTATSEITNDSGFITSAALPTVNNPTITITQGGVTKGSFTLNQATGETIALDAGGGGSVDIDNLTITENASQEIQAVAVIDQNTGIAKTWTGTMAEYDAIATKDPETEYIITDDIGGSATEIGEITEALNNKVDKGHQVIEFQEPTAENNYTWYRKYADGWVEQGGVFKASSNAGGTNTVINLPVMMADTHYTATLGLGDTDINNNGVYMWFCEKTTTTLKTVSSLVDYTATESGWRVEGMAA